jgi:hypothetical protein
VLPGQLAAIGLMTASLLGYEVLLTRAVAIQHWHHLTAVIVAVALLGLGSAGSLAAALAATVRRRERGLMPAAALATAAAMPLSLILARQVPLNMLALPWYGVQQAGWLLLYALCFLLPFFCGAVFITLAFMRWAAAIGRCYAADLGGSALGVILVLAWLNGYLLPDTRLESAFWLSAVLPVPAGLLLEKPARKRILCAAATAIGVSLSFAGPLVEVVPSDFKALPTRLAEREARVLWQRDTSRSRLTLVQSPAQHQAPGLSIRSRREAPRQWQVFRDGDAPLPLLRDAGRAQYRSFFEEVLSHAAFLAAPAHPRVLLLPGDASWNAWSAHWHGAAAITVVAPDRGMADLLAGQIDAGQSFLPPGGRLDVLPARRFLQTSPGRYDLIMADVGGSPMGSAATRVAFMLTREALGLLLDRLPPEGVLAFSGRAMPLPREALRLIHSLGEVLRERRRRPAEHLVVLRDWQNLLVLASPRPFSRDTLDKVSSWCRTWAFDRAAMPGLAAAEANRFHQKQEAPYFHAARQLLSEDAAAFVAAYPFDLTVTDDNRPFFYHFFRWGYWQALKDRLGPPWMLYAGWEYLLGVLALAVLLPTAALLIVAPLTAPALRRQIADRRLAILGYFGALGLGFMLIEIVLMQKVQLLMNSPTSAFAVVLVAVLLGAGGGSLWSSRAKARRGPPWIAALGVGMLALAGPVLVDVLAARADVLGRGLQVAALVLFLLVLAFPMGTLLPRGMARIRGRGAGAVAWAWGINGFCSVWGALAAPLLAIEIGFLGVMGGAAGLYIVAAGLYRRLA